MTPPWGINWQMYHKDRQDMPHIERMGYASFTIYEWMWNNRDFCNELLSVARQDAIFLDRDHPLSEQKDDLWKSDPARKGRNHADEWAQKVREGIVHTPLDRTYFLGLNEPESEHFPRQIDAYNEAYCRRMAEHGLRAAAYSFGVGHPSTVDLQADKPVDWSWYAASAAAILEGDHITAFHEYGAPQSYGWGYWCNRIAACPYPFRVVFDECGIDHGVLKSGDLVGWMRSLTPEQYVAWLDGFQMGMAERAHTRKVKILGYNIFSFDHGSGKHKDWHSFDIRPLRPLLEAYQWSDPSDPNAKAATTPPHTTHIPAVGTGEPPTQPVPQLAHPIADPAKRVISQRFGDNPQAYARFNLAGHPGLDFAVPSGTWVFAVDDGMVVEVENDPNGYGLYVKMRHAWGESLYAHLSSKDVIVGDKLKANTSVGRSGNTGNSTGPHLHFAMRVYPYQRGAPFDGYSDPLPYLGTTSANPITDKKEIVKLICLAALEFDVDPDLLLSQAWAESSFNPRAVSSAGAQGLMQIMPATWAEWSAKINAGSDPFDPAQNARVGAAYMKWLKNITMADYQALIAYGWGIGNWQSGGQAPPEWRAYANKIVHGRDLLKAVGA